MTDDLRPGRHLRTVPRLWVEKLWILDSLDTIKPLREISLSFGLNLIVSAPTSGNTSHGVGKTALCQLLRCVLEDPNWAAGSALRDELLHSLPDGAVAARVHVDGESWTVLKPWQHQLRYRAAQDTDWQALARDEVPNEHAAYVTALKRELVDILPVHELPGSGQTIEWQHLLAWCSRDQECRYRGYYHWRKEGTGFSLPAHSPGVMVKVVLGLLDDASLQHRSKKLEMEIGASESALSELKRRPADLLAHVRHQLATALHRPENSPFRSTDLFEPSSLQSAAQQRFEACAVELDGMKDARTKFETARVQLITECMPLQERAKSVENRVRQIEAAIVGNVAEVERLRGASSALQGRLHIRCEDGDLLVGECQYVKDRVASISLDSVRDAKERAKQTTRWQAELSRLNETMYRIDQTAQPLREQLASLDDSLQENQQREVAVLAAQERLREALDAYELYEGIAEGRAEWPEQKKLEDKARDLRAEQQTLLLGIRQRRGRFASRRADLESALVAFATQLPGFSWGVLREDDPRPFQMGPPHSTALAVLETLLGDFVCLVDSRNPESFHPGFLLHDSPREAELSGPLFWKFLSSVKGHQEAIQYVVTTSSSVPDDFSEYVRLGLGNQQDDDLLFRKRIAVEQTPLTA